MTRLGVMGGTFDPIHHGHLVAAEEVRTELALERVLFLPAGQPWQKSGERVTSGGHRLAMTELATADNPNFEVSTIELDREGPTYTIDTLSSLHDQRPDDSFFFITGADAIAQILTWKDPDEALDLATFVAVTRPGHEPGDLRPFGDRIVVIEIPALAISSTDIRARVASGRSIRYLVPEQVRRYVDEHRLYVA